MKRKPTHRCHVCGWDHDEFVTHTPEGKPYCSKCLEKPAEFDSPDILCEPCWNSWWFAEFPN